MLTDVEKAGFEDIDPAYWSIYPEEVGDVIGMAIAEIERLRKEVETAKTLFGKTCGDLVQETQRLDWLIRAASRGDCGIEIVEGRLGAWIQHPVLERDGLRDRKRIADGDTVRLAIDRALVRNQ
jgi:hypothetical protein